MKNLVEDGKTIQYTVKDADVKSGDPVIVGDLAGIAVTDGKAGDTITLSVEGVYNVPKGAGAIAQGKKVYVEEGASTVTTDADTDNVFIGYAWNDAGAADKFINVKLSY